MSKKVVVNNPQNNNLFKYINYFIIAGTTLYNKIVVYILSINRRLSKLGKNNLSTYSQPSD